MRCRRCRLPRRAYPQKVRKFIDGSSEGAGERRCGGRRINGQDPPASQVGEDLSDQPDRLGRILEHHFGQEMSGIAVELFPQPGLDNLDECEIGLVTIHHGRAGVDVGFDRIGFDQPLAETMDGRAGDFVDRRDGAGQISAMRIG